MRDFAHLKFASFSAISWVLATRHSLDPWTDFDEKYAKTRGFVQQCAFSVLRT